jgi:AcrR family transcriptional regulator
LITAAKLFTTAGYSAATTREIATAAGVRQASLYYYFPSKDDILAALLEEAMRPAVAMTEAALLAEDSPPARLWALVHAHLRYHLTNPANLGTLCFLPELRGEQFQAFQSQCAAMMRGYQVLVAAIAADTPADAAEFATRANLICALLKGAILTRQDTPDLDTERFSRNGANTALHIAACSGKASAIRAAATELSGRLSDLAREPLHQQPADACVPGATRQSESAESQRTSCHPLTHEGKALAGPNPRRSQHRAIVDQP